MCLLQDFSRVSYTESLMQPLTTQTMPILQQMGMRWHYQIVLTVRWNFYLHITDRYFKALYLVFCTCYLIKSAKITYFLLINWCLANTRVWTDSVSRAVYLFKLSFSKSQISKFDSMGNLYFDLMWSHNSSGFVRSRNILTHDSCLSLLDFFTSTCCWIRNNNAAFSHAAVITQRSWTVLV